MKSIEKVYEYLKEKGYNLREIAGKEKDTHRWISNDNYVFPIEDKVIRDIVKIVEEQKKLK